MEIHIKTEDENGQIIFEGTLSSEEHDFVLNVGLSYLLAKGATPFMKKDESSLAEGPDTIQ